MTEAGVHEPKTDLSRLLRRGQAGEKVVEELPLVTAEPVIAAHDVDRRRD